MASEFELRQEIVRLGVQVDMLRSIVQDLAKSIRATQEPMTIPEFAERTGLPVGRVRRLVKEGSIKVNGRKIPPTELLKFGI